MSLQQADFERLLELRTGLRRFLRWSEQQAKAAGLTPAQHQLLLAVRGHPDPAGPTIGQLADYLVLRHHRAVELADRAVRDWLVLRTPDATHKSIVRVTLTPAGEEKRYRLAETHIQELAHRRPHDVRALERARKRRRCQSPPRSASANPPAGLAITSPAATPVDIA